jgi:hypothetical protein
MATEVRSYTLTIPAGTTSAAPLVKAITFPPRIVDAIQIVVPPGPNGLVGFAVMNSGVTVIPYASDPWIITSAENITWPLEQQIESGAWAVKGYNTGTSAHSVYFRFLLRPVNLSAADTIAMHDIAALYPPSDVAG